jgi:hypothetical protein
MSDEKIDFEGLAKLIAACAKARVNKLKCGAVEVDFSNDTMALKEWPKLPKGSEVHGDGINRVEFRSEEPDDSQLLLEDPLAYEKMQLEG